MALIPLEEARDHVLAACHPLGSVELALGDALGLVLASDLVSTEDVPPFANTAMDGYAVQASDTAAATESAPVTLDVVGSLAAGQPPEPPVGPGQAVRIMTGAPMPPGADAVVMVERTAARPGRVEIMVPVTRGENVRAPGDDIGAGQLVFARGSVLTPSHLGVAASVGATAVAVHRRPRVGVLSTGDELIDGGGPLRPGQIRESNRAVLLGLLAEVGCVAVDLGIARDTEAEISSVLRAGLAGCDAVLSSGGVSVGDFDYVKVVLDQLSGGAMRWMQVAVRPAKPFAFGVVESTPVFGLPGNPVSSSVSFELFARPALRQMMGYEGPGRFRPRLTVLAEEPFGGSRDGRLSFYRVSARLRGDGRVGVRSSGGQGSHMLSAMARANALALVEAGTAVGEGEELEAWLLGELLARS
ncbi:MAG: molybdopterin molybdotransferase MoeA [Acidimicrobiales bacterium]